MQDHYTTAVLNLLKTNHDFDAVLTGLKKALLIKGHQKLLPGILRNVEKILAASSPADQAILTVADSSVVSKYTAEIKAYLEELGAIDQPKVEIDPSLIGGYIIGTRNKSIDRSYKKQLITLYRTITN